LQEQIDCALRYFCEKGDLKWLSLLMSAGGDPRSRGSSLEKDYTNEPDYYTSGFGRPLERSGRGPQKVEARIVKVNSPGGEFGI
jgi:hypothetical protein